MAALRAAVVALSVKNRRGGVFKHPPTRRGLSYSYIEFLVKPLAIFDGREIGVVDPSGRLIVF